MRGLQRDRIAAGSSEATLPCRTCFAGTRDSNPRDDPSTPQQLQQPEVGLTSA